MIVRRARLSDAALVVRLNADVQAIHVEAMPDWFKADSGMPLAHAAAILSDTRNRVFIAEEEGEPAGYAYAELRHEPGSGLKRERSEMHLHHISVRPEFRRHGIGAALIAAVRDEAKAAGTNLITLQVWHFNEAARAFFQNEGFDVYMERRWMRA